VIVDEGEARINYHLVEIETTQNVDLFSINGKPLFVVFNSNFYYCQIFVFNFTLILLPTF
jgi:hypothetical protein